MYKIEEAPRELSFGRQGENNILEYHFDYTAWAAERPGGAPVVSVILPYSDAVAPLNAAEQVSAVDNVLTIKVLSNLTATPGRGSLVIRYAVGDDSDQRSRVIDFVVEKGHGTATGEAPDLVTDWVNDATLKWGSVDATVTALASEADPTVTVEQDKDGTHFAFGAVPGKSAYEQAVDGGYGKSEAEFIADLDEFEGLVDAVDAAELAQTAAESARDLASGYAATASTKADAAAASALQLASGVASPAGTYADLAALISANPAHDKIYITLDDGKWAYHNGTAFVAGGIYQTVSVANDSVTKDKIKNNLSDELFIWGGSISFSGDTASIRTSQANLVIQSRVTLKLIMFPGVTNYSYTFSDAKCLILNWNSAESVYDATTAVFEEKTTAQIEVAGGLLRNEHIILGQAGYKRFSALSSFSHAIENYWRAATPEEQKITLRKSITCNGSTISFGYRQVFENMATGSILYFANDDTMDFTLAEATKLILKWDGLDNYAAINGTNIKAVSLGTATVGDEIVLAYSVGGVLTSPIPVIQQAIYDSQKPDCAPLIQPTPVSDRLKDIAPLFYKAWKQQSKDLTVVHIGDSISTTNYYTTARADAASRPPLMVELAYPTFIEEQLRWSGQKYCRYDTAGFFTETSETAVTSEYDAAWDWVIDPLTGNNRPALTRILNGTNVSVSYVVPAGVKRCDFIYRTDSLNAATASVSIDDGNGILQVWDEITSAWVEANGFTYSAQEDGADIVNAFGTFHKSMYQKRLKMKVVGTLSNTSVTITNSGAGRLTYWGIQTGKNQYMIDYILAARGGNGIAKLATYEAWDVDYYEPDLILWQLPILNQNMDVANSSFVPNNMGTNTAAAFAALFLAKAQALEAKSYAPELLTFTMWFGGGNYAINASNEWVYGYCSDGTQVSVPEYVRTTEGLLTHNSIANVSVFERLLAYAKAVSADSGVAISAFGLTGSGVTGTTWTIDGTHFNTTGAELVNSIIKPMFIV